MDRHSLRYRFYRELLMFGSLLLLFGAMGVITIYLWGIEDAAKLSYILRAEDRALHGPNEKLFSSPKKIDEFAVWEDLSNVPANVLAMFPTGSHQNDQLLLRYARGGKLLEGDPARHLRFNLFAQRPDSIYFFLRHRAQNDKDYYVLHKAPAAGYSALTRERTVVFMVVVCVVMVLFSLWLFGRRLSALILKPVDALTQMAASIDEAAPKPLPDMGRQPREIAEVANTLRRSLQRIYQYHDRETRFLRNVSHELRTPIAVIGSAIDVLEQRRAQGNADVERPLSDIRRSADDMRDITEALLWLARAGDGSTHKTLVQIRELLDSLVDAHQYLLQGKAVSVVVNAEDADQVEVELPFLKIILSNLIRNAVEHCERGVVRVKYDEHGFEIANPVDELAKVSQEGFGLGLPIVKDVAEKLGWSLNFHSAQNTMMVRLTLPL